MRPNGRWVCITFTLLLVAGGIAQESPSGGGTSQVAFNLLRSHEAAYIPGEPIEIVITIEGQGIENVRALGLEEILPPGWTLAGVQAYSQNPPHVQPEAGTSAPFEFAWISPPQLPCVFGYTVLVPEKDWGEKELYGSLLYRLDGGPVRTTPTVTLLSGPEPHPPTLLLRGANPITIQENETWVEPGCTALEYNKEDISGYMTITGFVDTATPGAYTLEYRITSPLTGLSASTTRTVHVVAAETPASDDAGTRTVILPLLEAFLEEQPGDAAQKTTSQSQEPSTDGTPSRASLEGLPNLGASRPIPYERPKDKKGNDVTESAQSGRDSPKEDPPQLSNMPVRTASELNGNSIRPNEVIYLPQNNSPHTERTPYSPRARLSCWIAGIIILGLLLAGCLLAWRFAYGYSRRPPSDKEHKIP